jgi:transposase
MAHKNMSTESKNTKRKNYTPEYKAEVVQLCKERNKSPYAIAKELGITSSTVRNWVMQATVDQGKEGAGLLTTVEREELRLLRKENRVLRQERDILKRATSIFVKECTS